MRSGSLLHSGNKLQGGDVSGRVQHESPAARELYMVRNCSGWFAQTHRFQRHPPAQPRKHTQQQLPSKRGRKQAMAEALANVSPQSLVPRYLRCG